MAIYAVFLLCVQSLFVQSALSQCIRSIEPACAPTASSSLQGCAASIIPSSGSFVCTSSSPIAPIGVSVVSSNSYSGSLCATGNLPLLGSVGVDGEFPTAGAGAISYGCGDESVAIVADEAPVGTAIVAPVVAAPIAYIPLVPVNLGSGTGMSYGCSGICYGSGIYRIGYSGCGCSI